MIEFKTKYSDHENGVVYTSEPGSPYLAEYEYEVSKDDSGNQVRKLVKTDRHTDVDAKIQAEAPSTDINLLMKRFSLGDTSVIEKTKGFYFDATTMPKTYAELFDRAEKAKAFFEKLPPEVKEKFANSAEEYWNEFGSDSYAAKMQEFYDTFKDHKYEVKPVEDSPKEIEY